MTNTSQIQALAALIHQLRPDWDQIATANHLLPYRHMGIAELSTAAIAAASDPTNRTPASLKWMKTQPNQSAESDGSTRTSKEPVCYICGNTQTKCRALHDFEVRHGLPDPHIFETHEEADANTGKVQFDPAMLALAAMPSINEHEDSPERTAAKARARAAVDAARQKSKWKPAPPPDDRRVQEPQPEETPA